MNGDRLREIGMERGEETAEKDGRYGQAVEKVGQIMALIFPKGLPPDGESMTQAWLIARSLDKICRLAARVSPLGLHVVPGEEDPSCDLAGYGILGAAFTERVTRDREPIGAPTEAPIPLRYCEHSESCVLDEGHGGDCVQRDGTRIHRQRRSGAQEASAKDEGEGMANPERIRSEVDYSRCNFCKGPYQGGKRIRKYGGAAIPGCSDEDACLRYASEHPERFDKERKRLRSGVAPSCATPGCVRTPGHLDECLMDGKEKTSA